jgi:hypothetical protein
MDQSVNTGTRQIAGFFTFINQGYAEQNPPCRPAMAGTNILLRQPSYYAVTFATSHAEWPNSS